LVDVESERTQRTKLLISLKPHAKLVGIRSWDTKRGNI